MKDLNGIVGALLTAFDDDGGVDRAAIARMADFLAGHCDAVSVLGAEVSEYRVLPPARRRALLGELTEALRGRVAVLAGVSAPTVHEVLELSELAAAAGADYAQVLLPSRPWGGEPSDAETVRFVEEVAARSPLPLVLYHHPGAGADPSYGAIVAACAVDNVAAMKDSSRDIARCLRLVEDVHHAGHASYLGTVQPLLAILLSGGGGAMMPPPMSVVGAAIRDAVAAGDLARAGELQRLIAVVPGRWAKLGLLPVAKAAMAAADLPIGDPAAPYPPVGPDDAAAIRAAVAGWDALIAATAGR
jgi:4-hydroxy-tetrahydrodipicolinate synthase